MNHRKTHSKRRIITMPFLPKLSVRLIGPLVLLLTILPLGQANAMENFHEARVALKMIYKALGVNTTFYCGCPFNPDTLKITLSDDDPTCGFNTFDYSMRAKRAETELIMPAWQFGSSMPCWHENTRPSGKTINGRRNCQLESEEFNRAEGDLHNLMFANGYINKYRSNFEHSDFGGSAGMFGQCRMVIDRENRLSQPPTETRGLIARAYLYMSATYKVRLSKRQAKVYSAWDKQFPPDKSECARDALIKKYQGNSNPILKGRCPQ